MPGADLAALLEPVPRGRVYKRVVDQMHAVIRTGRWAPGDKLPKERDLATGMRVSRFSIRRALHALEAQGIIECRKRKRYLLRSFDEIKVLIPVFAVSWPD
jgi:GntR family transcriptional repressor for pyruvate dehydrogenase complex